MFTVKTSEALPARDRRAHEEGFWNGVQDTRLKRSSPIQLTFGELLDRNVVLYVAGYVAGAMWYERFKRERRLELEIINGDDIVDF